MKQRCYLAGPMRGYPEYNFPAFHAAAAKLRAHGLEVWSPAENDVHQDGFDPTKAGSHLPMRHYMKRDLPAVLEADFVAVLPGWEKSQGACLEVHVARTCGIPVYQADTLQPVIPSETETSKPDDEYQGLLGTLAALDVVLVIHDQPVIAREIVIAAGPKQVMEAAKRSGYPFMQQLRKLYKDEGLHG